MNSNTKSLINGIKTKKQTINLIINFRHMYLCLHISALVCLLIVPRVVPKAVPGSSKQLSETAKGSIANVLKQATPITKSVSHHSD